MRDLSRFTLQVTFNISFKYVMSKLSRSACSLHLEYENEQCQITAYLYVVYLTMVSVAQNTQDRMVG